MSKIRFINKNTREELACYDYEGTFNSELEETRALLAYENGLDENEIEVVLG